MKSNFRASNRNKIELQMTSMIDVIFLLLIFFIFTTNFDAVEKLLPTDLSLPGAMSTEVLAEESSKTELEEITIRIKFEERVMSWLVNQRRCISLEEVRVILSELGHLDVDLPVVIEPDRQVPVESLLDIYDLCRQKGLRKIQFAVNKPASGGLSGTVTD